MKFRDFIEAKWSDDPQESRWLELLNLSGTIHSLAANSFLRTRHWKDNPVDVMAKWMKQMYGIKDWLKRTELGERVSTKDLDLAISALGDALLDFRKSGGILEPAKYIGGVDPSVAETLPQFAKFLQKRMVQKPVPGKQLVQFAQHYEDFSQAFDTAYGHWKESNPKPPSLSL